MKLIKFIAVFTFGALLLTSCKDEKKTEDTVAENNVEASVEGVLETASFDVEGMTCAMGCAKTIEKKLAELDGVKSATVDFDTKKATVDFDNAKQNSESLTQTVEKLANGAYKVENLDVKKHS